MKKQNVQPINSRPMTRAEFGTFTIRKMIGWYERGLLNLEPEFQRKSVWRLPQRSKLMNSILHGYPLPNVAIYKRYDERRHCVRYDVIDGKQRLESILQFVGKLRGEDFRFEAAFTDWRDGKEYTVKQSWRDMCPKNQNQILNFAIPAVWVQGELAEIREMFVRINSTGKALTPQEVRKAKYFSSEFLQRMTILAAQLKGSFIKMGVLSESEILRMKDVEFCSELVLSVLHGTVLDKKRALDQSMTDGFADGRRLPKAIRDVKATIRYLAKLLPDFRTTRFKKLADFYTLVVLFARYLREGKALENVKAKHEARYLLEKFGVLADKAYRSIREFDRKAEIDSNALAYIQTVREGGDTATHRRERERIVENILKNVFDQKDRHRTFTEVQRRIIWANTKRKKCYKCGRELKWSNFEIDHVYPYSKGGKTTIENSAIICKRCNCKKGAKVRG